MTFKIHVSVTWKSDEIQGNIPKTYATLGHVTLLLWNHFKTSAAGWAYLIKGLETRQFSPLSCIFTWGKYQMWQIWGLWSGVELEHPVSQRTLVDWLMHASPRTNASVNRFIAPGHRPPVAMMMPHRNQTMTQPTEIQICWQNQTWDDSKNS